ncbi:hypothetical protein H2199_000249 [Coniosporium tulheliwenetii]|uniref:Uncharacterized protein n=1 Tax=Coniosporium tulheliwenetii TaxID=3383036 RepID=A0ACC2ZPT3_9PEZI|nr:hypothetical protein H2199_000249 [Cladosporium sp. JES 115]
MTGRGDRKLFRLTIGLTLTTSSPILDPSSASPFFLILTARILTTPHTDSPITLATFLNPLSSLRNRSFGNINCVFPATESKKRIRIWPHSWPHYVWDGETLRDSWEFVTIEPGRSLEVRHEVLRDKIAAAGLKTGERYQAAFTDKCLGTRWWMFGSLEEAEQMKFMWWGHERERETEEGWETEKVEREGEDENGRWTMGEKPDDLALVIEKGEAEFEIGYSDANSSIEFGVNQSI